MRLSINSPAGMGRRAAIFQSSRLRYCIIVRWAMLGNSVECLPVTFCLLSRQVLARTLREEFVPCSREPANIAERGRPHRCYPTRIRCSILAAGPPARTLREPDGSACAPARLFHGPIVSTMILIPAKALSIWRCILSTSEFRNSWHSLEFAN